MKRFFIAIAVLTILLVGSLPVCASEASDAGSEITVVSGSLGEALASSRLEGDKLVLKGTADVRDFKTLASHLPSSVTSLDLSELSITAYTYTIPQADGRRFFPSDELPAWALFSLPISEIVLPASLKSIGEGALAATALKSVVIPSGIKELGAYVFYGCKSLTDIDLAQTSISAIPDHCFAGCESLVAVSLPNSLRNVGGFSFAKSALKSLSLPTATSFSDFALAEMPCLEEVVFSPSAVFGKGVLMSDTALVSVSGSPEAIPALFAAGCTDFDGGTISSGATDLGAWSLASSSSRRVTFNTLRALGEGALADMKNLNEIDVRELEGSLPEVDEDSFKGIEPSDIKLLVSSDSEEQWKQHPVWGLFQIVPDYMVEATMPLSPSEADISVQLLDYILYLSCDGELQHVSLYSADGMALLSKELSGSTAEVSITRDTYGLKSGDFIVVLVKTTDGLKAVKLNI